MTAGTAEQFWEDHYRRHERVFSDDANPLLVEVAGPLEAGSALDLGCGEGADAVWLARRGWQVTAVDVSQTALERTSRRAAAAGVAGQVGVERHDLAASLPGGEHQLVTAQYLHPATDSAMSGVLHAAAGLVAAGGLLLVVEHASVPPWSWADPGTSFPTPAELLQSFRLPPGQWRPVRLDAPSRRATGPAGQTAPVVDNVVAVLRT